jgi:hypothetical protein
MTRQFPKIISIHLHNYNFTPLWSTGQVDITRRIKELVTKGTLQAVVGPVNFGIPDPAS